MKLADARLYLVIDGRRDDLEAFLDSVLAAGVDVLQLRDKNAEASELLSAAEVFRAACDRHDALFIVNDRVDIALAAGADGVHLGQNDLDPGFARVLAPSLLIGRSTHSPDDIARANAESVDYFAVGPIYETPTKPGRAAVGTKLIEYAARHGVAPWFAIGGINDRNIEAVTRAGAKRVAVVRAITEATEPSLAAKTLRGAL